MNSRTYFLYPGSFWRVAARNTSFINLPHCLLTKHLGEGDDIDAHRSLYYNFFIYGSMLILLFVSVAWGSLLLNKLLSSHGATYTKVKNYVNHVYNCAAIEHIDGPALGGISHQYIAPDITMQSIIRLIFDLNTPISYILYVGSGWC